MQEYGGCFWGSAPLCLFSGTFAQEKSSPEEHGGGGPGLDVSSLFHHCWCCAGYWSWFMLRGRERNNAHCLLCPWRGNATSPRCTPRRGNSLSQCIPGDPRMMLSAPRHSALLLHGSTAASTRLLIGHATNL